MVPSRRGRTWIYGAASLVALGATPALGGEADVIGVKATRRAGDVYDFAVTVRSRDSGWTRYADRLEAVTLDGQVIGTRVLDHPHDDEQPFTRDLGGVKVTRSAVVIRVHFKPSGYDGATRTLNLPGDAS